MRTRHTLLLDDATEDAIRRYRARRCREARLPDNAVQWQQAVRELIALGVESANAIGGAE